MLGMVLRPVGSQPAGVYWRRRIVVLVVIAVVLVIVVRACSGGGGPATRSSGHHHGSGPGAAKTRAAGPCAPGDLTAAVTVKPASAAAGSPVRFTGLISNTSAVACLLQITPSDVVWTVRSGATKVWNCPTADAAQKSLAPSDAMRLHITWHGRVSSPPKCSGTTPATAGSYAVRLKLGHTSSPLARFALTATTTTGNSQG